jgi:hypothetical protein
MKIDTEMLSRQLRRLGEKRLEVINQTNPELHRSTDTTLYHMGYLSALDNILVLINSLPEGAK